MSFKRRLMRYWDKLKPVLDERRAMHYTEVSYILDIAPVTAIQICKLLPMYVDGVVYEGGVLRKIKTSGKGGNDGSDADRDSIQST